MAETVTWYVPGASFPLELLPPEPEPEPQLANPINRHTITNPSTSQRLRRLLIRSIPIIENGSNAKKIDLGTNGMDLAEVPLPPDV